MTSECRSRNWKLKLTGFLAVSGVLSELAGVNFFGKNYVVAQIIPDRSLGAEASVVTPNVEINGLPADRIDGGAIRDSNLFHSFQEFNIGDLQRVFFANPAGITNIFSRVTGSNLSEIFGTLGVNGNANLFLINPNGIIFGENASLDVGGSFVGSTADSVLFDNGFEFSATNPEAPPLLTINIPLGLQYGSLSSSTIEELNPGTILVQGTGSNLGFKDDDSTDRDNRPVGLEVNAGQTLALVGSEVLLEGGNLTAADGRIELGAVQGVGLVTFTPTDSGLVLGYENVESLGDVKFTQAASADASGNGGGSIKVRGRQVVLTDGSAVLISLLGSGEGGSVNVTASESVQVIGTTPDFQFNSSLFVENVGTGQGGEVKITAPIVLLQDGGQIFSASIVSGNGGDVIINASEFLQLLAPGIDGQRLRISAIGSQTSGTGDAGNVTINTRSLIVQDGAFIGGGTFAIGNGPNVTINASDSVQLIGTTGILDLENTLICGLSGFCQGELPSGFLADSFAEGNGGNFTINTSNLIVRDGAQISVSTGGSGNGGTVTVNASESVQLIGRSNSSSAVIPIGGFFADGELFSGLFAASGQVGSFSNPEATGEGGNLIINTSELIIRDGAQMAVSGLALAEAGDQIISADSILLNQGRITAETISGNGGNLNLQVEGILQLRNQSQISTTAGNEQFGGDGGNIDITAALIVAFPQENSDIKANAFAGNGGSINIDAQNILGFQLQEDPNLSDISASSRFGLDGIVNINTSEIEPDRELIKLPTEIVDVSRLINQNFCLAGQEGEFIITGKGGLSPAPQDTLNTDAGW